MEIRPRVFFGHLETLLLDQTVLELFTFRNSLILLLCLRPVVNYGTPFPLRRSIFSFVLSQKERARNLCHESFSFLPTRVSQESLVLAD